MLVEVSIFIATFVGLMLKMENKREWLYNIKHHRGNNWRKTWHKIPTTKSTLGVFVVLLVFAVLSSFFPFELNYMVWDFFFIFHIGLFLLAGASLYLFVWYLGSRAVRTGKEVGELFQVEGTEPGRKKATEKETFADGIFRALFDVTIGESRKKRKKRKE